MKRKLHMFCMFIILNIILTSCERSENTSNEGSREMPDIFLEDNSNLFYSEADYKRFSDYMAEIDEYIKKYNKDNYEGIEYGTFSGYDYYSALTTVSAREGGLSVKESNYFPYGEVICFFDKEKLKGFRLEIGWNTEGNYQKGGDYRYQCEKFLIGENVAYYSYASDCDDYEEIPVFMCIDGISRVRFSGKIKEYSASYALPVSVNKKEYISIDGILYEVDREQEAVYEAGFDLGLIYTSWCDCQEIDILTAIKSIGVVSGSLIESLPKGYELSKYENNFAVADINLDGKDEILAIAYPIHNNDDNNIGKDELWMFEGIEEKNYKALKLMDSAEAEWYYGTYTLTSINAYEGGFQMEYFTGKSPFQTVLRRFKYDKKEKDWYLDTVYENNSIGSGAVPGFTIEGTAEIGKKYLNKKNDAIYYKVSIQDYMNEHKELLYEKVYNDLGGLISFTDKKMADKVEKILLQELEKIFAATEKLNEVQDVLIQDNADVFINENTLVICFTYMDTTVDDTFVARIIPICIDLRTFTRIDFKEYLSTEDFIKLCKDSNININQLRELYEHYDDYEYLLKAASPSITLCLLEEGLAVLETSQYWPNSYMITRDKLWDTQLSECWNDWSLKP